MKTIKSILEDVFRKKNLESKLKDYHIFDIWADVVGPRVARHTQPKRLQNHVLWVVVDTTVWTQQLTFLEGKIRSRLNEALGVPTVEKIRFQLGELVPVSNQESEGPSPPEWRKATLEKSVKENIEKEVAVLKDEELKKRLEALFQKSSQLIRYHEKE